MNWNHLFGDHCTFDEQISIGNIVDIFPQIKSKINYLRQKFIAAQEYSTLYVISHPQIGPSKIDIEKLRNAITHIREGKTNFSILFISANPAFDSFENVYVRHSTPIGSDWTQADSARWKEILDEFKFSTTIWD